MARPLAIAALLSLAIATAPRPAAALSVLSHQAIVDAAWEQTIVPALHRRYADTTAEQVERARAFAYGGSHIADLGYFPLGDRDFTDFVHYVRTGDFIANLLREAQSLDEYAFALGALAHWVGDTTGHPEATNRAVAEIYPDLRAEYGDQVTYAENHSAHMQTEFRFDVFQLSQSRQTPDLFRHAIEFEVSKPVLDRAFAATYGLHLDDLFVDTDVAITTYRWGFRELIHEATGIAWALYRGDIQQRDPQATEESFVYDMSRADFEKEFGDAYREPGYVARAFGVLANLVPDVGPFQRLPFKPLPPTARQHFTQALEDATAKFRRLVRSAHRGGIEVSNLNLDTGRPSRGGDYRPADDAYATLLETLDEHGYPAVSAELIADVHRFYADPAAPIATKDDAGEWEDLQDHLMRLDEAPRRARPRAS